MRSIVLSLVALVPAILGSCGEGRRQPPFAAAPPPPSAPAPDVPRTAPEGGWVPAEHKKGEGRWKDTVVYVDGVPVGVLDFGELPVALTPVWIEDEVSAPLRPGERGTGARRIRQRHYRLVDYLAAVGVELARVVEVHVVGPRLAATLVVSGAELRRRGREVLFRFGGDVNGKAIPVVPPGLGNGKAPDKIGAIMVYLQKEPPRLVRNRGLELHGELVTGVPYYGEPLRGGVRVYVDDRLAAVIKRRLLEGEGGGRRWSLLGFLEAQGVDTTRLREGWIVRDHRRRERIGRGALEDLTFEASPQAHGQILVGPALVPAQVLALHTRVLRANDLPHVLAFER